MRSFWICSVIIGTILIGVNSGCMGNDSMLEEALELAKGNRQELERVLEHFKNDELRYEAAKFLILNMPGHYSYADTVRVSKYYDAVDSLLDAFHGQSAESIRDSINVLARRYGMPSVPKIQDIEIISSDYLIKNIDEAFIQWETSPWCENLSFEDFCEYLLPYKYTELQPFENWRSQMEWCYRPPLEQLKYCDTFRNSSLRAAALLNHHLGSTFPPGLMTTIEFPVLRLATNLRIPFGYCEDYVGRATVVMRCAGIPVVWDFTPQWASQKKGHDWNVVQSARGCEITFCGYYETPLGQHKAEEKISKAFRHCYSRNPKIEELNAHELLVPTIFQDIFLKDVTDKYTSVVTGAVPYSGDAKYVYLGVYNGRDWIPVDFAKARHGAAEFVNVAKNCVFVLLAYDKYGVLSPVGDAFIFQDKGLRYMIPDFRALQTVSLGRKYPVLEYVFSEVRKVLNGEFQAANNRDFSDAVTVYTINNAIAEGVDIIVPDTLQDYRYWRYINNEPSYSTMSEICFFAKDGTTVAGEVICDKVDNPQKNRRVLNAFDRNLLTKFTSLKEVGGWIGMDMGNSRDIGVIRYYAPADGNSVEEADEYELLFWHDGQWRSLGKTISKGVIVTYEKVPANALLRLRDLTKGEDEWIFTWENGMQRWW